MTYPSSKEFARKAGWVHACKFAKQIELAFADDVKCVWYREVVPKVFVPNLVFFDMVHVSANDVMDGSVIEGGDSSTEVNIESP